MIFVTGGTGFLGHNLLPMLTTLGVPIRAISRHPEDYPWLNDLKNLEIIRADVTDREAMFEAIQGCDYVIHAAGKFRFWGNQRQFERTNIMGSENVMDAALTAGIKKFIHISTAVVIGNPPKEGEIDETYPTNPADAYQKSKLAAEKKALRYYAEKGLPVVVLRPGAFYGPYGRYAFNSLFFEDPLKGLPIGVNGGKYYTFPTYIKDAARSIILALEKGEPGEVYNICSQYLTHRQVDKIIAEEAGISNFHIYIPGFVIIPFARILTLLGFILNREPKYPITLRSYIFNNWRVSAKKAECDLGFESTPFREGVRATLAWYRDIGIWKPKGEKK